MKKIVTVAFITLLVLLHSSVGHALKYDFESSEALPLDGLTIGTFTIEGVPLEIQAGSMTQDGDFTIGGANATLSVIVPAMPMRGGLGVDSDIFSGTSDVGLTQGEGIVFSFDSLFIPEAITLTNFTLGNGAFEAVRIFVNGSPFGDFQGGTGGVSDVTIDLTGSISTLGLTPLLGDGLSSDPAFLIASIEGITSASVSEPATIFLLGCGLVGIAGITRKKFNH